MNRRARISISVAFIVGGALALPAGPAIAAPITYVVNSTADDVDGGGCQVAPDDCTLREAITAANASPGLDKIQFALGSGVPTINVGSALPTIADRLQITGNTGGATRVELSGPPGVDGTIGLSIAGAAANASLIRRMILNGFGFVGIRISSSDGNVVSGTWIGLDETGTAVAGLGSSAGLHILAGDSNRIGGDTVGTRNVISGNAEANVLITTAAPGGANEIRGNYLGTNADGTPGTGSTGPGIDILESDSNIVEDNVIGGSAGPGVSLRNGVTLTAVASNWIGLDAMGAPFPNGVGVLVGGGTGNAIFLNRIDHNTGLGIDLGNDGVTPNDATDADTGPNDLQNFPVLTRADNLEIGAQINGRIRTTPNFNVRINLYVSPACDPSGYGEGNQWVGSLEVTTDAQGRATFSELVDPLPVGSVVTSTAADTFNGGTSEFGPCQTVIA